MTETDNLDIAMWDDILSQQGLSMEAGRLTRVTYGARYYDTAQTHNYQERADNYNVTQMNQCRVLAEKIKACLAKGMSMRATAKSLSMSPFNARRTLRRFEKNFSSLTTDRAPAQCSSEDSNVD